VGRKNRYSGILQPWQVGRGVLESAVLVLYDIEDDRVRSRISSLCLDYGLERIQFSAFLGKLDRNRREEICMRIRAEVATGLGRIRIIPICQSDLDHMWTLDQYCLPEEAVEAPGPQLRVIKAD
jgi:CRISPR-associated protein Cas2